MATEGPVTAAPLGRIPLNTAAESSSAFIWKPNSLKMHVTRPKSAKGRKRPSLHKPQGAQSGPHCAPSSPPPASSSESPGSQKPRACAPTSPTQGAPDEFPELLQVPMGASSSLNKYPVLPSISRRGLKEEALGTVARKASSLQLSSIQALYQEETCTTETKKDARAPAFAPERKLVIQTKRQGTPRPGTLEEHSDQEHRLLLAVRSPSGQRFVHHFRPTDDLQTVLTVAEQKNRTTYRHCSIETMEVPRRRFTDLTKSLQECGILHKSVLGIAQEEGEGRP
ncbi:UBX domain-containing protein 10 [Perognathus longimembris pacificus]|uniref:UBX domain-containing protein 10 n=1 Tax=Perognathus longimembris pacificus TaxID=214514 RepID=UPI00201989E8|nr:UBX domain-containing protein 10 [Perognathus longimembris pacificus]